MFEFALDILFYLFSKYTIAMLEHFSVKFEGIFLEGMICHGLANYNYLPYGGNTPRHKEARPLWHNIDLCLFLLKGM